MAGYGKLCDLVDISHVDHHLSMRDSAAHPEHWRQVCSNLDSAIRFQIDSILVQLNEDVDI